MTSLPKIRIKKHRKLILVQFFKHWMKSRCENYIYVFMQNRIYVLIFRGLHPWTPTWYCSQRLGWPRVSNLNGPRISSYLFHAVSRCFTALFHAVSLLFHCCFITVSLLFHCCFMLFHCCFTVFHCCFTVFHCSVSWYFKVFHCPVLSCFMTMKQVQWERAFRVLW